METTRDTQIVMKLHSPKELHEAAESYTEPQRVAWSQTQMIGAMYRWRKLQRWAQTSNCIEFQGAMESSIFLAAACKTMSCPNLTNL